MKIFGQFADDEYGSVDTIGYILLTTLLAVGGITGLTTLRDAIVQEGGDLFHALRGLNQGFEFWIPDGNGLVTWTDDGGTPPVYNNPSNATQVTYIDTYVPVAAIAGQAPPGISLSVAPGIGEATVLPVVPAGVPFEPTAIPGEDGVVVPSVPDPLYPATSFPPYPPSVVP